MSDKQANVARDQAQARRMRRRFRKGVFIIPSLFTTANIFCGFFSIMESLAGTRGLSIGDVASASEHFNRAAINIGFAALFDFLDGRIARMTGATSEFGIELDSIADVLSFGIAPALLAFSWGYGQPGLHKLAWAASFIFVICGALRLARFNVQARQPKPDLPPKNPKIDKKAFVGLPIPMAASLIAAIAHFSPTPFVYLSGFQVSAIGRAFVIDGRAYSVGLLLLVVSLSLLMVSTVRYSSFKGVGTHNYHPRTLILAMALVVLALWFYSQWSLLIITITYAAHGPLGKLWSLLKWRHARSADQAELELDSETQS